MAQDTVTNFLISTKTVLDDVKAKLLTITDFGTRVSVIAGDQLEHLLRHAPAKTIPPFAVIAYMGSNYQQTPRRNYNFSVMVSGIRKVTSDEDGQDNTFDILDSVIGVIDHEVYNNQIIYKVKSDKWQDYTNSGICIYKIDFIAEDY